MTKMEELYQETQDQDEPGQGVYGNQWCQDCLDKAVEHADVLYDAGDFDSWCE